MEKIEVKIFVARLDSAQIFFVTECGWLWTEPVSYSKCSKWRPLAFPHARSHPHSPGKDTCLRRTEKTQFPGSCFPRYAETLVRRGGIINHRSIAYSLSNISAKNYRNRLMWVESIVCNIGVVFLRHSVRRNAASTTRRIGRYFALGNTCPV